MNIYKTIINKDHWTTDWIPISYTYNNKSYTFFWHDNYILNMLCRTYYKNKNIVLIGDVWLNPDLRGQKINNEKISVVFMKKIIAKIWKFYPSCNKIILEVHQDNIPAIKLYQKLNFKIVKKIKMNNKDGYLMIRYKK